MVDTPDNLIFEYLRRLDGKLDRVIDDLSDLKVRGTNLEEGLAGVNRRLDRIEVRLDRVERRLDLIDQPH
jgi:predicted nuclease with TOPRIM domain